MKQGWTIFAVLCIFAVRSLLIAEEPEKQKAWRFQGKAGAVEIKFTRFLNKDGTTPTSLQVYSPDGAPRSVAEEAAFLAAVLDDLPKEGISIQSLDWISFRFNESEAVSKVATYAASSKRWRESLKTKNMSVVYPLVTSFLNASGAYEEWDRVFKQHGLTLKVVSVEEVIMEPFSQAHASCPANANCKNLIVPMDALVQMNIVPIVHK
jgi:hypothetical protein